ncbi:hypothetical protein Catovirus_1_1003 [Catovirus CTV1]|uniref:Uncharacterized protein n=1 Tax=Catovirus CTV1 TaxID=1977631 RepID=A0A1V0SB68_9VIRU|nr:hypothetical protein Catovirus_1_1003 [Catovirus CTV1]
MINNIHFLEVVLVQFFISVVRVLRQVCKCVLYDQIITKLMELAMIVIFQFFIILNNNYIN